MTTEFQEDMFKLDDKDIRETTYLDYLSSRSPILSSIIENITDNEDIPPMIDHVTSELNDFMESLQYLFIINDNDNPVFEALIALLRFFKSYTVDINKFNVYRIYKILYRGGF